MLFTHTHSRLSHPASHSRPTHAPQVQPAELRYEVLRTKVEVTMTKADNLQWVSEEGGKSCCWRWCSWMELCSRVH